MRCDDRTLAIIHTTALTIEPLKGLAAELLPGCRVLNWLDDSILPQLARDGGHLEHVADRWLHYVHFASRAGAGLILSACSSVGELVPRAQAQVRVPVLRIDEPMAELAVSRGGRIGLAATLSTTLQPTLNLLRSKAAAAGQEPAIEPLLVAAAFERLAAGDQAGHDQLLAAALRDLAARSDTVVLAQASMARVLPALPEAIRAKFLTSPRLAMQRVQEVLEGHGIS